MYDREFLLWIYNRLKNVHGEDSNYDYMHKLHAIIQKTPRDQYTANVSKTSKDTGAKCSICGEPQFNTVSGITCPNGHGGADAQD